MSAPDTNVEKQSRNHWGPLFGISAVLVFVGVLFAAYMGLIWEPVAEDPAEAGIATAVEQ